MWPPSHADAQTRTDAATVVAVPAERPPAPDIRKSLAAFDYGAIDASPKKPASTSNAPVAKQPRSFGRQLAGGVLGAVAGFFAGGFLGVAIQGDCMCDDPGLTGFMIGAPIGAVVGGMLGAKY